ncbi:unnamed protein product [Dicrocoelium dendriticum]|nr:unnamed protein product [Dicrocoelium dendriticum]
MSYSQSEKPANTSDEPLVLRPPVGAEVDRGLGLQFRSLFRARSSSSRRNRFICHCLLSIFLALLTALVLLLVLFILGIGHLLPAHSSSQNYWGHQSMCRVSIPELRLHVTEMISVDDNMFNVTLLGEDTSASKLTRILHLCKDGLTVIRTADRCYIRPMRADWRRVCSREPVRLFEDGIRMRPTVSARLYDEAWFSEPLTHVPKLILNSYILALCDGVPALRLVSKPPWGYTANTMVSPVVEKPHVEDTAAGSDNLEVLNALMSPESALPSAVQGVFSVFDLYLYTTFCLIALTRV